MQELEAHELVKEQAVEPDGGGDHRKGAKVSAAPVAERAKFHDSPESERSTQVVTVGEVVKSCICIYVPAHCAPVEYMTRGPLAAGAQ